MRRKLTHILTFIRINEIKKKRKYITNIDHDKYIKFRNENELYLILWNYIKLNNVYVFDILSKKIKMIKITDKIKFKRKGMIIETNNYALLFENYIKKYDCCDMTVISPKNMTTMWKHAEIIYYDFIENYLKHPKPQKKPQILVILECYQNSFHLIKKFINYIGCENVWFINTLPLYHYFGSDNSKYLNINDLGSIVNLWMDFDNVKKKKYRTEIIQFLHINLNQLFTKIYFPKIKHIQIQKVISDKFDMYLRGLINEYYNNWKRNLTNQENNIYSIATQTKIFNIESKIYDSMIKLILSISSERNTKDYFKKNIYKILNAQHKSYNNLQNFYSKINIQAVKNGNNLTDTNDFKKVFDDMDKEKEKKLTMIKNYGRFLKNHQTKSEDSTCTICYNKFYESSKVKLICDHIFCIECTLQFMSKNTCCPLCREPIDINKIAIIQETIDDYHFKIANHIHRLDDSWLILTDLESISNCQKFIFKKIINIGDKFNSGNIFSNNIQKINFIITPLKILPKAKKKYIFQLINHFLLFSGIEKIIVTEFIFDQHLL